MYNGYVSISNRFDIMLDVLVMEINSFYEQNAVNKDLNWKKYEQSSRILYNIQIKTRLKRWIQPDFNFGSNQNGL